MQVTYIAITPEDLERTISKAVERGIESYKKQLDDDIRSVSDWADYLGIDRRTIIKRIENGQITPVTKRPYRISKKEIVKLGGGAFS